jgi:hypothetical protein
LRHSASLFSTLVLVSDMDAPQFSPSLRGAKRRSNPESRVQSWIASLRSQ